MDQREFNADGEEEEDDANFCQDLDGCDIGNEIEPMGADQRTGDQEPGDRRESELMKQKDHRDRHGIDEEQICEDIIVGHTVPLSITRRLLMSRSGDC